jgi:enoyl-CoA hydratase
VLDSAILVERKDKVGIITINRPEVRNALDKNTWRLLNNVFAELENDPTIAVIVVTGAGEKAFVAGADLNSLKMRSAVETLYGETPRITAAIENNVKPTIAAINGFALGGGLELAMACDIRICSRMAKLGQTEINVGILPGAGGTQRLSRLVGPAKAKEMIFTGKIITAEEAEKIGLVNCVVEPQELMDTALAMAKEIAGKSNITLQVAKQVVNQGLNADLTTGLMLEKLAQSFIFGIEDRMEGITAFLEKRPPKFRGK